LSAIFSNDFGVAMEKISEGVNYLFFAKVTIKKAPTFVDAFKYSFESDY
jgi:hypothetical protein